jgi:cell division protein FtsB
MKSEIKPPKARFDSVKFRRVCFGGLIVACAFAIMHAIFGNNGLMALRHQQKEYRDLQKQVQELQRENEQVELQNSKLQSDPKAIERLAREQLRFARPGEIIYTLPDQAAPNGENSRTESK